MSLALQQAQKSLGNTKQNPAVGCVIVRKDHIITSGFTQKGGRPHAESNAINLCKSNLNNSELYVTLEPCSHYGKTSPCTNKIIKKKIKKVFFSIKDPDPRSFNKSTKQFKKSKIKVKIGILDSEVKKFYRSYYKFKQELLPYVSGKIAISKDLYTYNSKNKWITNELSRGRAHLLRSYHDCVLTSYNTVKKDNPELTCRILGLESKSPTRIILDKHLNLSTSSNIVKSSYKYKTIIFFINSNKKKINILKKHKIKLIKAKTNVDGNFDLENVLIKIKSLGFARVLVESGVNLITGFLKRNLFDIFHIFISSNKIGKNGSLSFKKNMQLFFKNKKSTYSKVNLLGDKLHSYELK